MPCFNNIDLYQNRSKIKLFLLKKYKIFELWGLRPLTSMTIPYCRFLASRLHSDAYGLHSDNISSNRTVLPRCNDTEVDLANLLQTLRRDTESIIKALIWFAKFLENIVPIGVARIFDWGGANQKSSAMTSSQIFEKGSFFGQRYCRMEDQKPGLTLNQNFAKGRELKLKI